MRKRDLITRGIIKENPLFVAALGVCPALALTSTAGEALAMGLSTLAVMMAASVIISAFKRMIPDEVRIPCYMLIIATLVTILQYLLRAFLQPVYSLLGIYLPLIVVNCLVLERAEVFASKRSIVDSALDAFGMGLGYTLALFIMGTMREFFGNGSLFGISLLHEKVFTLPILTLAPGGFFMLGIIMATINKLSGSGRRRHREEACAACPAASSCRASEKEGESK